MISIESSILWKICFKIELKDPTYFWLSIVFITPINFSLATFINKASINKEKSIF